MTLPFAESMKARLLAAGWYANRLERIRISWRARALLPRHAASADDDADMPYANLHVSAETFEAHCRMIAETCHPIDLDGVFARRRRRPARCPIVRCSSPSTTVIAACSSRAADPAALPDSGGGVRLLRAGAPSAAVLVRRRDARRGADAVVAAQARAKPRGGRDGRAHETPAAAAPRAGADDRNASPPDWPTKVSPSACTPLRMRRWRRRRPTSSARARVVPVGARVVDRTARRDASPIRSARRESDYTAETVAIAADLGFTATSRRARFARQPNRRSSVRASSCSTAVTAAELAHRIAYAWPR